MKLRAALVIAAVYGYFLIFAQFSFVELLRSSGVSLMQEKVALGTMAVAGIGSGFFASWRGATPKMVRIALGAAAGAAALAPFFKTMPSAIGIALATGCALGVATVSLAALLPAWCGVVWIGLGTGLGYALCNLPFVFNQSPSRQAWTGALFPLIGLLAVPSVTEWLPKKTQKVFPIWSAVALFTALVWMDSAAFFIIQHADDLKNGTWRSDLLWRNAIVHFSFAIAAGFWLVKGPARLLPALSWVILGAASLAVNQETTRSLAGWLYPAGVSLYSVALIAWPGWFSGAADCRKAGWSAAILFSIAGWFGSANGIGMAQTLQSIPVEFIAGAGCLVIFVMVLSNLKQWRAALFVFFIVAVAMAFPKSRGSKVGNAVARGRQVYLSEGCIHCHSQYVRPGSLDEMNWGPARDVKETLAGEPVLIGNRRQGPDLTNVGARRSEKWLKLHFIAPEAFAPGTVMPSYAHLFESGKGDDLVKYLKDTGVSGMDGVLTTASKWKPQGTAKGTDGKALYVMNCAVCHGASGLGNGRLSLELVRKPANLTAGPWVWSAAGDDLDLRISRIIKFGLIGTDMPGHEAFTDSQILALKDYVLKLREH